jgi:hypothetical protein
LTPVRPIFVCEALSSSDDCRRHPQLRRYGWVAALLTTIADRHGNTRSIAVVETNVGNRDDHKNVAIAISGFASFGTATMNIQISVVLCVLVSAAGIGCGDEQTELARNVGLNACNALNGAYRGKILSVVRDPVNQSGLWVYSVQREGSRATYAPVDNTTAASGKCPDGEP